MRAPLHLLLSFVRMSTWTHDRSGTASTPEIATERLYLRGATRSALRSLNHQQAVFFCRSKRQKQAFFYLSRNGRPFLNKSEKIILPKESRRQKKATCSYNYYEQVVQNYASKDYSILKMSSSSFSKNSGTSKFFVFVSVPSSLISSSFSTKSGSFSGS